MKGLSYIIDTYYIRDVGTSKEFYVGDKIRGFKSGSNIYCPRKVIFYSVDFESYDNTGSTKITFIEDSGSEKLTRITLSNPEYSYNKLMKDGYCPFYDDYYIEPTNSSLFGGIF